MALTAQDYIRPLRRMGGGVIPVLEVTKGATVWSKGDVIVSASGLALRGADNFTVSTFLGIAVEDSVATQLTGLIYPALPDIVWWGRLANDATGATVAAAAAHRYLSGTAAGFEISYNDTIFFINVGETSTTTAMVIALIDAIGTAWGAVEFVITASAFNQIV